MEREQKKLVQNLLVEIKRFLLKKIKRNKKAEIIKMIYSLINETHYFTPQKPNIPSKAESLYKALNLISDDQLIPIKDSILLAINQIKWNIDDGLFYQKNSEIGVDYLKGNMHTELIGPENGIFKNGNLRLGLFLLDPNILYKDHKHPAPELYLNLSNGTSWRFEKKGWINKRAGSIIYNEPFRVHAIKVSKQPFLALWCWPHNSLKKCILVER